MSIAAILEKFIVIDGDCGVLRAGISASDRQLIATNVSFIYHLCASIRFDEVKISKYMKINFFFHVHVLI